MLRENYAGAASNNNMSTMQYGIGKPGLAKYQQIQYNPNENKKNIFERKTNRPVPRTRDQFQQSAFTQILGPQPDASRADERFKHDKLNVTDIAGSVPDTHGKYKRIEGRDYMDMNDIDKTRPR